MTQEEKELLLKDLCARLKYGVICHYNCAIRCDTMEVKKANCVGKLEGIIPFNGHIGFMVGGDKVNALFHDIKPYLRPMSSMTIEKIKHYHDLCIWSKSGYHEFGEFDELGDEIKYYDTWESIDYLNSIHVDYRGLIPMGLAIEVTKENNPYEDINL